MFDLGVADVDHDSRLDVFSAAHNFPGAALLNDGAGGFHAAPAALGFGQLLGFPGFEETMVPPVKTVPGVYVFVKLRSREAADSDLTLDAYELPAHVDIRLDPIRNARSALFGLPFLSIDEIIAKVDAITADEVAELANELYAADRLSAACIGADEDCFRSAVAPVSAALAA